jgi:hypothetical protein
VSGRSRIAGSAARREDRRGGGAGRELGSESKGKEGGGREEETAAARAAEEAELGMSDESIGSPVLRSGSSSLLGPSGLISLSTSSSIWTGANSYRTLFLGLAEGSGRSSFSSAFISRDEWVGGETVGVGLGLGEKTGAGSCDETRVGIHSSAAGRSAVGGRGEGRVRLEESLEAGAVVEEEEEERKKGLEEAEDWASEADCALPDERLPGAKGIGGLSL